MKLAQTRFTLIVALSLLASATLNVYAQSGSTSGSSALTYNEKKSYKFLIPKAKCYSLLQSTARLKVMDQ